MATGRGKELCTARLARFKRLEERQRVTQLTRLTGVHVQVYVRVAAAGDHPEADRSRKVRPQPFAMVSPRRLT